MSIPRRDRKFVYLAERQDWTCPIWRDLQTRVGQNQWLEGRRVNALHHRLHNRKENRRRFPLFIHSMLNLVAVNNYWHLLEPRWGEIALAAADRIEATLHRWPKACAFVNGRVEALRWAA